MRETIIHNIESRLASYSDLIREIDPADLGAKLDIPKNKSVAQHLWCIVGSRESYAKALAAGKWQGFSCSMSQYERSDFENALRSSGENLRAAIHAVSD